jgi:hypothetical protein
MFPTSSDTPDPVEFAGAVVGALGDALDDEAPYSAEMTTHALDALIACSSYLRTCLGPAHRAAIPDYTVLAAVLLAVHAACTHLHAGLQETLPDIDRRQWPTDQTQIPITRVAALRTALASASDALRAAATEFAAAHTAATNS